MSDGRKNNGGHSTKGKAGRKPKADEIKKIELMDSIAAPEEVWAELWKVCKKGNTNALQTWVNHRFGKPKEQKDITTNGNDINIPSITFVD